MIEGFQSLCPAPDCGILFTWRRKAIQRESGLTRGFALTASTRGASNPHADRFSTFASGRPATRDSLSTRASPSCAAPVTRPRRSSRVDWLAGSQPENQGGVYLLRADSSTTTDFGNSSRPASKTVNSTTVCSKPWVQVGQASRIMAVSGSFLLPIRQMRRYCSEHLAGCDGKGHAVFYRGLAGAD